MSLFWLLVVVVWRAGVRRSPTIKGEQMKRLKLFGASVLSTYEKNGRACKKEGRGKEKKQKKRSGQCSAMPQFLFW